MILSRLGQTGERIGCSVEGRVVLKLGICHGEVVVDNVKLCVVRLRQGRKQEAYDGFRGLCSWLFNDGQRGHVN